MVNYIERYGARLDGHRLAAMRFVGHAKEIRDEHTWRMHNTFMGAWIKQWWNWGDFGTTDSLCHCRDTDRPLVWCSVDMSYERGIGDVLGHVQQPPLPNGLGTWLS